MFPSFPAAKHDDNTVITDHIEISFANLLFAN